eukprot:199880_1
MLVSTLVTIIYAFISLNICINNSLELPPNGAFIQFQNKQSKKCMLDREEPNGNILGDNGVTSSCCISCDNQLYKLEAHSSKQGFYKLVNVKSNSVIISNSDGRFRTYSNIGYSDDKYWEFVADRPEYPNYFKLVNLQSNEVIVSNSDGRFRTYSNIGSSDDKYWKFNLENAEIIAVDFDLDNGVISSDVPFVAGGGVCNNADGGTSEQEVIIEVSKTMTETSSFTRTSGFAISFGLKFETGIPFVAKGEISTEISASHEISFGEEYSIERSFKATLVVTCGPGEIIEQECVVFEATLDIPYTITLLTDKSRKTFESFGVWKGTSSYEFVCDFNQLK